MLFERFSYSPKPAKPDVRLTCVIIKQQNNGIGEYTIIVQYQIHPQHRNQTPNKSQWSISYEEEVCVFAGAFCEGLVVEGRHIWGLYKPFDNPVVLGITKNGFPSKIAKFDNGTHNGFWHGYPVDHNMKQEYPPQEILATWRDKNYITKADISKIISGRW